MHADTAECRISRISYSQVSQFSCDDEYVAAQVGCFQYFTGLTGTIQSYNYAGLAQIKGMNYKNCIRAEEGYCCIQV